jgi:hypothetical protein
MPKSESSSTPLPVAATLQDLALLRASGVELGSLLPAEEKPEERATRGEAELGHQEAIEQSNVFVGEMRKAIRIGLGGDVDRIRNRIDKLSNEVERAKQNVERIQDEQLEMLNDHDSTE